MKLSPRQPQLLFWALPTPGSRIDSLFVLFSTGPRLRTWPESLPTGSDAASGTPLGHGQLPPAPDHAWPEWIITSKTLCHHTATLKLCCCERGGVALNSAVEALRHLRSGPVAFFRLILGLSVDLGVKLILCLSAMTTKGLNLQRRLHPTRPGAHRSPGAPAGWNPGPSSPSSPPSRMGGPGVEPHGSLHSL